MQSELGIMPFLLSFFFYSRRAKRYSASINPSALRRKAHSGKELQPKVRRQSGWSRRWSLGQVRVIHKSYPLLQVHKGHRFFPRQFKVATVCEYCSKLVPLLESGEVCEGKRLVKITKVVWYTLNVYNLCVQCVAMHVTKSATKRSIRSVRAKLDRSQYPSTIQRYVH